MRISDFIADFRGLREFWADENGGRPGALTVSGERGNGAAYGTRIISL